jgi:hypothetical protein
LDGVAIQPEAPLEQLHLQIGKRLGDLLRGTHQEAIIKVPDIPYQAHDGCDMAYQVLDGHAEGHRAERAALVDTTL